MAGWTTSAIVAPAAEYTHTNGVVPFDAQVLTVIAAGPVRANCADWPPPRPVTSTLDPVVAIFGVAGAPDATLAAAPSPPFVWEQPPRMRTAPRMIEPTRSVRISSAPSG